DKETTERVLSEYDYKKDPKGTRYYFKEIGYNKPSEKEYVEDVKHNFDGKEKTQDLTPIIKEEPVVEPKEEPKQEEPKAAILKLFPQTGEEVKTASMIVGLVVIAGAACVIYFQNKK
ncbi:LPXTG cell wall anchor domain-containing protein, partial [Carnobacterium maltaromaticum]